jgi:excisionase family DNA binding protein
MYRMSHVTYPFAITEPDRRELTRERTVELLEKIPAILLAISDIQRQMSRRQKDFFSVEEVAALVQRSPYTVRAWIKAGRINATRVTGTGPRGRLLVPRAELGKLIHAGLGDQLPADVTV